MCCVWGQKKKLKQKQFFQKFASYFSIVIEHKEYKELLDIISVMLNKQYMQISHDEVYRDYTMGLAYFFIENYQKSNKFLVSALQSYNESSILVKYVLKQSHDSDYKLRMEKLKKFKQDELQKQYFSTQKNDLMQKFKREIDLNLIVLLYDWLLYQYLQVTPDEGKAYDCYENFLISYQAVLRQEPARQVNFLERHAQILLLQKKLPECRQQVEQALIEYGKIHLSH